MSRDVMTDNPDLRSFTEALDETLGEKLIAIIEYGLMSRTGDGEDPSTPHNLLVLVDRVGSDVTTAIRAPLARMNKKLKLEPTLFSEQSFLSSLDVFPVEAHEIKSSYRVILGKDVVADAEIHDGHLRHQLEFELRSKKLYLVGQLMHQNEDSDAVGGTLMATLDSVLLLGQYYLRLIGKEVVSNRGSLVQELTEALKVSPETLSALEEVSRGERKVGSSEKARLVWGFLSAMDALIEAVDGLSD